MLKIWLLRKSHLPDKRAYYFSLDYSPGNSSAIAAILVDWSVTQHVDRTDLLAESECNSLTTDPRLPFVILYNVMQVLQGNEPMRSWKQPKHPVSE